MKYIYLFFTTIFTFHFCLSQVGIGTSNPHSSSILDMNSSSKGFLPPRMTKLEANNIKSPAIGLLVYCTNCCENGNIYIYNGSNWNTINPCSFPPSVTPTVIANIKFETPNPHSFVIGQPDFVSGGFQPISDQTFVYPTAIQISSDGKVFIVDSGNNRVLRYNNLNEFIFNFPAELVFGQPDFVTSLTDASPNKLHSPTSIIIDNLGTLWVTDRFKDRVLGFNNASIETNNFAIPDFVIGAHSATLFDTIGLSNAQKLREPQDLALDYNGNIWIGSNDGRILHYNRNTLPNYGAIADKVLGRSSFAIELFVQNPTASQMSWSSGGLFSHPNGDLFVSDFFGNRVLLFKDATSKSNGADADFVYFQNDFISNTTGITNNNLDGAGGISIDRLGNLYVSDYNNHRVLIIEDIENKPSFSPANHQIGQLNFVSNLPTTTQIGLNNPLLIKNIEHKGQSLIAISDVTNNRIVVFGGTKMELIENSIDTFTLKTSSTATDTTIIYSITQQPSLGTITILDQETGSISIDLTGINVTSKTIDEFEFIAEDVYGTQHQITQPFLIKK